MKSTNSRGLQGCPSFGMTLSQVAGGNHFDVGCILGSDSGTDAEASGYLGLSVSGEGSHRLT